MALTLVFAFAMVFTVVSAADPHQSAEIGHGCSNPITYTYANKTKFTHNRDAVLASLRASLHASHFATSSSGDGTTDPVYGLVQCRPYLTKKECLECYTVAQNQMKFYCLRSNGARIHYDGCFVRYENTSFFGQGTDLGFSTYCASNMDEKPGKFKSAVNGLMRELKTKAVEKSFAVGKKSISGGEKLYGAAQCWESLVKSACYGCLSEAHNILMEDCVPRREGRGMEAGCFVRYATYPFFSSN